MKDLIARIVVVIIIAGLIIGSLWFYFLAPCALLRFSANKDIPARCLDNFNGARYE